MLLRRRVRQIAAVGVLSVGVLGAPWVASPVAAATITVTTFDDVVANDGLCSLREAVEAANTDMAVDACPAGSGADVIVLAAGTYQLNSQLEVSDGAGLTIQGQGAEATRIDGANATRLINLNAGPLTIDSLEMANGYAGGGGNGGAIDSSAEVITINNARFSGNVAASSGGAIRTTSGEVIVNNSTFVDNGTEEDSGGAIRASGGEIAVFDSVFTGNYTGFDGDGGALRTSGGAISVFTSTLDRNTSGRDGGAIRTSSGMVIVLDSTISNNTAVSNGGGLRMNDGQLEIVDSTLDGNEAGEAGGGIWMNDGMLDAVQITLTGSTSGGGIEFAESGTFALANSIIAGNTGGDCTGEWVDTVVSEGGNIDSDGTCNLTESTDQPNTDPLLGPLADNGGPTLTRLPLAGSPAIDSATEEWCTPDDQRGVARPQDGNNDGQSLCDVGAVEVVFIAPVDPTTPTTPSTTTPATPLTPAQAAQPVGAAARFTG